MGWLDDLAKGVEKFGKETASDLDKIVGRILGEEDKR